MFDDHGFPTSLGHPLGHNPMDPGGPHADPTPPLSLHAVEALAPEAGPGSELHRHVAGELGKIANFLFFSIPNPTQPNVPIMEHGELIGVEVHEMLHRFEVPEEQTRKGLRARNIVGQPAAQVHMTWRPIPDDFVAYPGVDIPPTPLDPTRSQRFMMHAGHFIMGDEDQHTGFKGFGTGRTFPVMVGGKPQLRIAAVVDVVEGFGELAGHEGMLVVNGHIEPPTGLALSILLRVTDPHGRLAAKSKIPPLRPMTPPDPDDLYLVFLGDSDPKDPVRLDIGADGSFRGATGPQRMRLMQISYDVHSKKGIRTKTSLGAFVGQMDATALFDPLSGSPPYPFQTTHGVFTFKNSRGNVIGTLEADMTEGRALPTHFDGVPLPVFRVGGMAPATRGTGCFEDAVAIFSVNSFISLVPNVLSGIFVLHLSDPGGRVRKAMGGGR